MTKEEFISNKMKTLVSDEGYDRKQAYAIALSYWNKSKKQEGGTMQDQHSKKMYPLYNKEISYPVLKVEPATQGGVEGYRQYYTDPNSPDADYSFLSTEDYMRKKEAKEGRPNYEPYLQMYLKRTGNREGINVHYQQAGMVYDPNQYQLPNIIQNQFQSPQQNFSTSTINSTGTSLDNYNLDLLDIGLEDLQNQELLKQQQMNKATYEKNMNALSPEQRAQVERQADVRAGLGILDTNPKQRGQGAGLDGSGANANQPKPHDINRVNIANPYGGIDLSYALNYAGRGFATKNPWQAGIGTGLSLLKGARSFLSGFATGKEDKRVANEMMDKQFNTSRPYTYLQQGGNIKNSDVLAQNAIVDNPNGNINLEDGEFVKRNDGTIQPVVGEPHIKNGKIADGVDAKLDNGDKILSDYTKLRPSDIKDLKDRYKVSLKKGDTFADAQRKIDSKLGIKKLENEKATLLEKMEKANNIEDSDTRQLSVEAITKKIGSVNGKINTLSGVREDNFEYLFNLQEEIPKKGTGKELYDENGKEVKEVGGEKGYSQEGGMYIKQLAEKHNIPLERAMELVKMQQGGEQQAQMEQLFQIVANALQQGASPEQVIQEMVAQGVPQEQAVQLVQQVAQQLQGQSPQEEVQETIVAQQGVRIANKYENPELYIKQNPTSESWESFGELLKSKPKEVLTEIKRIHPELYSKYFPNDKIGSDKTIADFQLDVNRKYNNIVSDAEKLYGKDSKQVSDLKNQIEQDNFLINDDGVRSVDSKLGNYTSTRPNYQLNVIPKEELDKLKEQGINTAFQLKESNPELYNKYVKEKGLSSDFWLGDISSKEQEVTPKETEDEVVTTPPQEEVQGRINTKTIFPNLETYIPLFSAIQPIAKEQVAFQRLEPVKLTPEPMLAEQERQRQADVSRVEQMGLSPQQQEAILAQGLASSQMASNDAISKVEQYNAQNQFQTDQYNAGIGAKEQLQNASFNQNYQDKMMATLANMEDAYRKEYYNQYLQGQANRNYITNLNKLNALSDQYAITPDGVEYLNNKAYQPSSAENDMLDGYTPEQLRAYAEQKTGMKYAPQQVPAQTQTQVTPTNQIVTQTETPVENTRVSGARSNSRVMEEAYIPRDYKEVYNPYTYTPNDFTLNPSLYNNLKFGEYGNNIQNTNNTSLPDNNANIPTYVTPSQGLQEMLGQPPAPFNSWEAYNEYQQRNKKAQLGLKYRGW